MGIKRTNGFGIHPNKLLRNKNPVDGIIVTHMVDLIDQSRCTQADMIYDISDKNQFNDHFFYFRRDLGYTTYGYHFFFETYRNEIFWYMGCSLNGRSEYLQELVNMEILNPLYKNHTLLVINGNFEQDLCEKNMYTKAAYQLGGFMSYEIMENKKLLYLSDLIDKEKAEKSNFMFSPMTHFDKSIFKRELVRFKAK